MGRSVGGGRARGHHDARYSNNLYFVGLEGTPGLVRCTPDLETLSHRRDGSRCADHASKVVHHNESRGRYATLGMALGAATLDKASPDDPGQNRVLARTESGHARSKADQISHLRELR
jgi:hypothetical protein